MSSAYSVNERPAHFWEGPSNPVMLERNDRRNKIIPHLVSPAKPPTKYRRPSEGRRDSFGGGHALVRLATAIAGPYPVRPCFGIADDRSPCLKALMVATSKAISRRYPLTGDCFDGGVSADLLHGMTPCVHAYGERRRLHEPCYVTFKAVSKGGVFLSSTVTQAALMVVRLIRVVKGSSYGFCRTYLSRNGLVSRYGGNTIRPSSSKQLGELKPDTVVPW